MIPKEIVREIIDRSDIEQLIGSYVTLKRAGSNVKGLCPFHNEKTPSFTVYPDSRSFYCFGCGAGGDAITFVMKYNNLDYAGAVEFLAARAGIEIPRDGVREERGVLRKRVLEMNLVAAKYFRDRLFDPQIGGEAMAYLQGKRKLSSATIKHFGLGFAPNHPFEMLQYMRSQGFTDEELQAGYLEAISQKTNRPYSIFRNRIIFPIIDTTGAVIAFGGRVMDDSKPKYLNTNDTPAYKKGRNLFALNFAKNSEDERLILCEGYMDVIALHAAGFQNAVAGLGTALTSEQARLLARYTKKIVLTYDSDEAGQRATERALQLLTEVGLEVKVLVIKGAKDPDEFIKLNGNTAFSRLLDESRSKFSYRAAKVLSKHDISLLDEKIAAAKEICTIIAAIPSSVERDVCLNEAVLLLDISKDVLSSDVDRMRRNYARNDRKKQAQNAYSSARGIGDKINPDHVKNVAGANAEEAILGLMLAFPENRALVTSGKVELSSDDFVTDLGRRVFEALIELHESDGGFETSMLNDIFGIDEIGRIQKMIRQRLELSENGIGVLTASVERLKAERKKQIAKESGDLLAELNTRRAQLKTKKENT